MYCTQYYEVLYHDFRFHEFSEAEENARIDAPFRLNARFSPNRRFWPGAAPFHPRERLLLQLSKIFSST
jgi:hypothetical protein